MRRGSATTFRQHVLSVKFRAPQEDHLSNTSSAASSFVITYGVCPSHAIACILVKSHVVTTVAKCALQVSIWWACGKPGLWLKEDAAEEVRVGRFESKVVDLYITSWQSLGLGVLVLQASITMLRVTTPRNGTGVSPCVPMFLGASAFCAANLASSLLESNPQHLSRLVTVNDESSLLELAFITKLPLTRIL
eukprot:222507-Amphidinium_carterae.2